jgi:tetratricopeptide (TPR) repeat protein
LTGPRPWSAWVVLALLAVLPYVPGLRHGFVYDDHGAILENEFFRSPGHVREVVTLRTMTDPQVLDGQRPSLLLSMFLDRAGSARPQAWRHHVTNVLLHAGCVLLLFGWVRGLLRRHGVTTAPAYAWLAAAIFALHPLLVEAVQVPSYREDLLFAFGLLMLLAAGSLSRARWRWPLQVVALLLAAGAKESFVAVPPLLVWLGWCFPAERARTRAWWTLVSLSALLAAAYLGAAYAVRPLQAAAGVWNGLALRWPENLWTMPWLWVRYLGLLLAPWPLSADRVVAAVSSPASWRFLLGLLALLGALASALAARRRAPLPALGLGWLLLAFLPVSNLVPLYNPMADRYAYFMVPGFALCAAWLLLGGGAGRTRPRRALFALLAAAYVLLILLRLDAWRSDRALWEATRQTEPRSARALAWLGVESMREGDLAAAREFFRQADALNPQEVTPLINLAILDGQKGDLAGATAQLREAVRRRPDKAEGWANLAVALELQGSRAEALDAAEQARKLDLLGRFAP